MTARIITIDTAKEDLKRLRGTDEDLNVIECALSENSLLGEPFSAEMPVLRRRVTNLLSGKMISVIFLGITFDDHRLFDGDIVVILAVRGGNSLDWKLPDPDNLAQAIQAILNAIQYITS